MAHACDVVGASGTQEQYVTYMIDTMGSLSPNEPSNEENNMRMPKRPQLLLAGLALFVLSGCGSLPDLKPFADATSELQVATVSVGDALSEAIPASLPCPDTSAKQPPKCRDYFQENWRARIEVLDAVAKYADSLAQVAKAGESGAESAEKVGKAMDSLLSILKLNPLTETVKTAAIKTYAEVARVRAMKAMSEAVNSANGPLAEIVSALKADMTSMRDIMLVTSEVAETTIAANDDQIGSARKYAVAERNRLLNSVSLRHQEIGAASKALANIRSQNNVGGNTPCTTEKDCIEKVKELDQLIADDRQRLVAVEGDVERLEKAYAPIQAQRDAVTKGRKQALLLIATIDSGLTQWMNIHQALGEDLRRKMQPNTRQLIAIAQHIHQLVEDMRKTS